MGSVRLHRIPHYGQLTNPVRRENLARIRALLHVPPVSIAASVSHSAKLVFHKKRVNDFLACRRMDATGHRDAGKPLHYFVAVAAVASKHRLLKLGSSMPDTLYAQRTHRANQFLFHRSLCAHLAAFMQRARQKARPRLRLGSHGFFLGGGDGACSIGSGVCQLS